MKRNALTKLFSMIFLAPLTVSLLSCVEEGTVEVTQDGCQHTETWEISVPEHGFDNSFANGEEWKDPRGDHPNLGNFSWSQLNLSTSSTTLHLPTEYQEGIFFNRHNDKNTLDIEILLEKSDFSVFLSADTPDGWPAPSQRNLDRVELKSATIKDINQKLTSIGGEFTDLKVSSDGKWISGKFHATFISDDPNLGGEELEYSGEFRGGLKAHCHDSMCKPYSFILDNQEELYSWRKNIDCTTTSYKPR